MSGNNVVTFTKSTLDKNLFQSAKTISKCLDRHKILHKIIKDNKVKIKGFDIPFFVEIYHGINVAHVYFSIDMISLSDEQISDLDSLAVQSSFEEYECYVMISSSHVTLYLGIGINVDKSKNEIDFIGYVKTFSDRLNNLYENALDYGYDIKG